MTMGGGGNGQWARARNAAGAKSLVAELKMDRQRRFAAQQRSRAFWRRIRRRVRQRFSRPQD